MSDDERSTGPEDWDRAYRTSQAPWDVGRAQPAVVRLADAGAVAGRVLDVGCGSGDNGLELARRGLDVTGVDWSPVAIEAARAKAAAEGLATRFEVRDVTGLDATLGTFDDVLDCGMFHTLDDDGRPAYLHSLAAVTRPGSRLYLLCFSDEEPWGGGPRRIHRDELRAAFADGWAVRSIVPERFATTLHDDGARAWLASIERTG